MKTSNKANPPSAARLIDSLRHLDYTNESAIYDIVDNSIDEALGGFCSAIFVTINADGSITVKDNGRGIPVDMHPVENRQQSKLC